MQGQKLILSCLSKIIASYTHEIRNILAIIGEAQGLAQDILNLTQESARINYQNKLNNSFISIEEQIARGDLLSNKLNFLAHTTDQDIRDFNPFELLTVLISLTQRIAYKQKVFLQSPKQTGLNNLKIRSRPALFAAVLFKCLEFWLQIAPAKSTLHFQLVKEEENLGTSIFCSDPQAFINLDKILKQDLNHEWKHLQDTVKSLKADLQLISSRSSLYLSLPFKTEICS